MVSTVQIVLTRECNLNCSYCSAKSRTGAITERSADMWDRVLGNLLPQVKPKVVKLGGGETTLYRGLSTVVRAVKKYSDAKVLVLTHGFVPDTRLDALMKAGVDAFGVSWDLEYPLPSVGPIETEPVVDKSIGAKNVLTWRGDKDATGRELTAVARTGEKVPRETVSRLELAVLRSTVDVVANVIIDPTMSYFERVPDHVNRLLDLGAMVNVCPLVWGGTHPKGPRKSWQFRAGKIVRPPIEDPTYRARYMLMASQLLDIKRRVGPRLVVSGQYLRDLFPYGLELNKPCVDLRVPPTLFLDWRGVVQPCMDVAGASGSAYTGDGLYFTNEENPVIPEDMLSFASFLDSWERDVKTCSGCYYSNIHGGNYGLELDPYEED